MEDRTKSVRELMPLDFRLYPVWTWFGDSDESLVIPVENTNPIDDRLYDTLFIYCNFILNDGTITDGSISISLRSVYDVTFFLNQDVFVFMGGIFDDIGTILQLSAWFNKPFENINPFKYTTTFQFYDGVPIRGKIDLISW
jgi:hypothetical protein